VLLLLPLSQLSRYSGGLRAGRPGFNSTASRSVLGPTQPPIQWVPGTLSPRVKRPGREAKHSFPSSVEVKMVALYLQSRTRLHGIVLNQLSTGSTLPSLFILPPPASPPFNHCFLFSFSFVFSIPSPFSCIVLSY
jgi:hypothetical protein